MAPRPDGSRSDGSSRGLTAAGAGVPPPPHAVGASAVTAAGNMPGDSFSASPCGIFARCDSGRQKLKNIFSCASCRRRERLHRGSSGARLGHCAGCAGAHGLRRYHSAHAPASVRHWNTIHRHTYIHPREQYPIRRNIEPDSSNDMACSMLLPVTRLELEI